MSQLPIQEGVIKATSGNDFIFCINQANNNVEDQYLLVSS
jgi:hypothetical protein